MGARTQKGEEMKQRILSSAQRLFHAKGFEATSVREIVEDVGCAKGTFYLYFETKMDLLYEIACDVFFKFSELIEKTLLPMTDAPFVQMEQLLNALVQNMQITEGSLRLLHTSEMLKLLIESKMNIKFVDDAIEHIVVYINEGIKRGYFRKVDPILYAKLMFNMCHEMLESTMLFSSPGQVTVVKDELVVIIRKILEN